MGLSDAHKGYEYQDLFSAFHIVNMFLENNNAVCKIDRKETENDKFDDFTMIMDNSIVKRQIKYSENKILEKADLSTENYDLALDVLFKSWQELPKDKNVDIRLCLAWEFLSDSQELNFLSEVETKNSYGNCMAKILKIELEKIWPCGQQPISSWRRLRKKSKNINRNDFSRFIQDLIIEVNLPKSSADLTNPGQLENLLIDKLRLFGVGKYPNDKKSVVDVAMHIMHIIKRARAKGESIEIKKLIYELGLMKSYGNIEQEFRINKDTNILCMAQYLECKNFLFNNNKVCLVGAPGSGKSWFIHNFVEFLKGLNIGVIQHYCYIGIDDEYDQERITINVFMANLISDLIESMPYLAKIKKSIYGVDFDELQLLLDHVEEDIVIVVDGLDHIGRIYNLHKETMRKIDTEIIQVIEKLNLSDNVKIILASQPLNELSQMCKNSFKEYIIKPWNINQVKEFIIKNKVNDISISNAWLSDLLLEKCSGNPLYLTYLVNELCKYSSVMITRELIEKFPGYSNNLESYYSFLMARICESQPVAQILAGSPFPLTESELKEITHLGKYVTDSLEVIRSILSFNSSSGGYVIYHESFRRYILGLLENNEVSIDNVIYLPLIEWLRNQGFYRDKKSYLNLLVLLFESKRYSEILEYCCKEFVINSVYYGNNMNSIKKNFTILMKAACKIRDYGAVIKCTELCNMIYSFDYSFDENSEYYYWALGLINGFDKLKDTLVYEGKNALPYNQGLKVCYLCSQNNVIPDWNKYIELLFEAKKVKKSNDLHYRDDIEEYKYYICACLDTGQDMKDKIQQICDEVKEEYRQIVIAEFSRRNHVEELQELIGQIHDQENWINSINVFLGKKEIDEQYINIVFDKLKQSDAYSDDTFKALNYYYNNIEWIILNYSQQMSEFIYSIENRNWYYNWLIFIYEVNKVIHVNKSGDIDESKIIEAYSWLTRDMECFKGNPRTCDLYKFETIIFESIKQPLKYITSESTWKSVLEIIEIMSSNTMTTLRGSIGGPLPSYRLFDLFLDIVNELNCDVLTTIFKTRIEEESKRRIYSYLADYSFKYAIILVKSKKVDEAQREFRKGVEYLLSYSFRKDRTLSHLIDSVESICKIDENIGTEYIMRLRPLANAVVWHTDGRDTSTYPREWFEVLARQNKDVAITCITYDLLENSNYWILEECLDYLLEVTNSKVDPVIENILFKTRPNNTAPNFIKSYLNNINSLVTDKEIYLARQSMYELLSRLTNGVSDDYYDIVKVLCEILDIDTKVTIKPQESFNKNNSPDKKQFDKNIRNFSFDEMTNEEVLEYIMTYGIKESEVQGLYYYMQSIQELNIESRMFLSNLIRHIYERNSDDKTRERILMIFDNLSIDSTIMAFIYISIFLNHKDGWGQRLTQTQYYVKAIEINKEVTEQYFFDYFYYYLSTVNYSTVVGCEIINALAAARFDGQLIIQYWDSLFEIINFRLPEQCEYNWKEIIQTSLNFNDKEKMIYLVLSRLKFAEASRYKWILSGLDGMLKDSEYRLAFIKPFKYYLKNHKMFLDYSLIMLLELIVKRFKTSELDMHDLKQSILDIYPTSNEAINYLIRYITGVKRQRIYQKYITTYNTKDEKLKWYIQMLKQVDNRIGLLEEQGVNIGRIVQNYIGQVLAKDTRKELQGILFNRTYSVLIPNAYFYDMLMKYMSYEVDLFINQYAGTLFVEEVERLIYEIVIDDINYIISVCNSNSTRPSDIKLPIDISNSIENVEIGEWVRLAYYERCYSKREKYKNNFSNSNDSCIVFSAIGFKEQKECIPILKLSEEYHIFDENKDAFLFRDIFDIKEIITSDVKICEDIYLTYKSNSYLGLRGDVLNAVGVKLLDRGDGIIGVNKTGKTVLRYSTWKVDLEDVDSDSYCIPYLVGAELKISESMYGEICKLFNEVPKCYTIKID